MEKFYDIVTYMLNNSFKAQRVFLYGNIKDFILSSCNIIDIKSFQILKKPLISRLLDLIFH